MSAKCLLKRPAARRQQNAKFNKYIMLKTTIKKVYLVSIVPNRLTNNIIKKYE